MFLSKIKHVKSIVYTIQKVYNNHEPSNSVIGFLHYLTDHVKETNYTI